MLSLLWNAVWCNDESELDRDSTSGGVRCLCEMEGWIMAELEIEGCCLLAIKFDGSPDVEFLGPEYIWVKFNKSLTAPWNWNHH